MKTLKRITTLSLSLCIFGASCNKDNPKAFTPPVTNTYTTLSKAFTEAAPASKTTSIDATKGGSFYGSSGTRYTFYANSFQDANGKIVTGNIEIGTLECLTRGDMIFGKMLTMSNGNPLFSGGEVKVIASQGGSPVYIRPGYNYKVSMPTNQGASTADMNFFRGNESSASAGNTVNWNLVRIKDTLTNSIIYDGDTISMYPDSLGSGNCDRYASLASANVTIKLDGLSGTLRPEDLSIYTLIEGYLNVMGVDGLLSSDNAIHNSNMYKIKSHIVVCAVYNGDFYAGILSSITPDNSSSFTVNLSKTTPSAFKVLVNALR